MPTRERSYRSIIAQGCNEVWLLPTIKELSSISRTASGAEKDLTDGVRRVNKSFDKVIGRTLTSILDRDEPSAMPDLFSPYTLKGVTLRNRIAMSPMTMYRSVDGRMNDYHVMLMG